MKLDLVDRRGSATGSDHWATDWPQLVALAGAVGPGSWAVDLVLVDDAVMTGLNASWRGDAGPTDVLSFSYVEHTGSGTPDLGAGEGDASRDLWLPTEAGADDAPVVGELVLAPAFVVDRCREQGWDSAHEWPLLVVHGCLHLLGWEHDSDVDRRAMQDREAEILARHDLPHPLRKRS